ncbi:MAG: DNA mismatch repair endonuclease MutL [Firmicutes bacterium]|jgi:DNA mismatch repair protein MutL|nr:DNA mismatch repair endonuclease MutL [Bacillota bacterium]
MRAIQVLPTDVANKIAAGEVVERPASVVKELVENSIDAGARQIEIEIREGGKEFIRVTDNGSGIRRHELKTAFLRHATSKIASADDLVRVLSLGFRGEALPSIASCSEVEIISRTADTNEATRLKIVGGRVDEEGPWAGPPGTTVIVRRLFYNTPARLKFMKQAATEKRYCAEYVTHMALAHPGIAFHLIGDNTSMLRTPGSSDLLSAFGSIYGSPLARKMIPVEWESAVVSISGYVSPPEETKSNRSYESVFVNGRWVQDRLICAAIEKGYENMLPTRRFPIAVLHLEVDPTLVDVNVHPAKTQVRFRHESDMFREVMLAVRAALHGSNLMPRLTPTKRAASSDKPRTWSPTNTLEADFVKETEPSRDGESCGTPQALPAEFKPIADTHADRDKQELLDHMRSPLAEEEIPPEAEAVKRYLSQASPMGQILNTFIAVSSPYGLWLIDQHVAHERILYESVLARHRRSAAQMLLSPLTLTFSPTEAAMIERRLRDLAEMGFAMESFGGTTYILRSTPIEASDKPDEAGLAELLVEIVSMWHEGGDGRREKAAAMIACKAAVKAGKPLETVAQRALLSQLARTANPFACPHGRPIMIAIDRQELERRFGRG